MIIALIALGVFIVWTVIAVNQPIKGCGGDCNQGRNACNCELGKQNESA